MVYYKRASGFTIAELLIALAITGILVTAIALAFQGAVSSYSDNIDIYNAVNKSRQAVVRIISQLRTADAVSPTSPINECALITSNGKDITYRYNSGDKKLYLVDNSNGSEHVVCDGVNGMTFRKYTATKDSVVYVKSVQISMDVESGGAERTVSAATTIRRSLN